MKVSGAGANIENEEKIKIDRFFFVRFFCGFETEKMIFIV